MNKKSSAEELEELYLLCCAGNEVAQRDFYQRMNGRIYNYLRRINSSNGNIFFTNDDVENFVSDTWLKLWKLCSTHKLKGEAFTNYILKVARNLYFDGLRKPKLPVDSMDDGVDISDISSRNPEKIIQSQQQNERYIEALKKLSGEQRTAYLLKADGYSVHAIAEITDANIEAVRSRIRMAKDKLRKMLND